MAAPLPSGLNVSVVPQAPQVDPRMFAGDPQGALASMQAGFLLSQELASLENKKAQRALEAEKIKLDMQKNKVEQMTLEETANQLPSFVGEIVRLDFQEKMAASRAAAAQAGNVYSLATEQAALGVPKEQAKASLTEAQQGQKPASVRAGELAREQAKGQAQGQLEGVIAAAGGAQTPTGQRIAQEALAKAQGVSDWKDEDEVDPNSGAIIRRRVRYNPDGSIYEKAEPYVAHLPSGAKSAGSIAREVAELQQLRAVADSLDQALTTYEKSGDVGAAQAFATQWASTNPAGVFSLAKRFIGQWMQTKPTKDIVAQVQNFSNAVANGLFGASLTASEMQRLDKAVPSAGDISNPEAFRSKLKATIDLFESKIESARAQGIVGPTGRPVGQAAPATVGATYSMRQTKEAFGDAPVGTERVINGQPYRMVFQNGQKGWKRLAPGP